MTNADRLLQFLQEHKDNRYCDDCLSELADVRPRQQVYQICRSNPHLFKRQTREECGNCGKVKITRSLNSAE